MDLEQEGRPSICATTNLKGHDRTVSDNAIDDELVGGSLRDQFAAFLDRDAVALCLGIRYFPMGRRLSPAQVWCRTGSSEAALRFLVKVRR